MISNRCARKSLVTNCNSIISKNYLRFLVDSNEKQYKYKNMENLDRIVAFRRFLWRIQYPNVIIYLLYSGNSVILQGENFGEMDFESLLNALNRGLWVSAAAKDCPDVADALLRCADMCHEFNMLPPSKSEKRNELLKSLLGKAGNGLTIHSPFRCDFGFNIRIGDNFVGNFNLSILDEAEVTIGDNVMIGPNCSLITITHALTAAQRNAGVMAARPITIGNNVWIAANVVVLPGVEIGEGAVIGAGSVVTKSIPANMLAVGNPCRPLRPVTEEDRVEVFTF